MVGQRRNSILLPPLLRITRNLRELLEALDSRCDNLHTIQLAVARYKLTITREPARKGFFTCQELNLGPFQYAKGVYFLLTGWIVANARTQVWNCVVNKA